jgi:hypothetical protein
LLPPERHGGQGPLHPVEWNIGEVAGELAVHCVEYGLQPHQVHAGPARLSVQSRLARQGVELSWPNVRGY